jgi:hypothetical protein
MQSGIASPVCHCLLLERTGKVATNNRSLAAHLAPEQGEHAQRQTEKHSQRAKCLNIHRKMKARCCAKPLYGLTPVPFEPNEKTKAGHYLPELGR